MFATHGATFKQVVLPDLELAKLLVEGSQTEAVQLPASFSPGREEVIVLLVVYLQLLEPINQLVFPGYVVLLLDLRVQLL